MIRERGIQLPYLLVIGHEGPLWLSPTRSLTRQPCSPKCFGHSTAGGHEMPSAARVLAGPRRFSDLDAAIAGRAAVARSPGVSSSRIVNEIRRRFGSTSNTLTRTTSPGVAILRGLEKSVLAIVEMCTSPSWWTPTSTKAPNAATFVTTPSIIMPGFRSFSFFHSLAKSCRISSENHHRYRRGTGGSNPVPSSSESSANRISFLDFSISPCWTR